MHHDVKISGFRNRTHVLWIRKRVCNPLHHSAPHSSSRIMFTSSKKRIVPTEWFNVERREIGSHASRHQLRYRPVEETQSVQVADVALPNVIQLKSHGVFVDMCSWLSRRTWMQLRNRAIIMPSLSGTNQICDSGRCTHSCEKHCRPNIEAWLLQCHTTLHTDQLTVLSLI